MVIPAVPAAVFAFHEDEANFERLHPNVARHEIIERLPSGAHHCVQVMWRRMLEVRVECRTLVYEPPTRIVSEARLPDGALQRQELIFEAVDGGTRVTVACEMAARGRLNEFLLSRRFSGALALAKERLATEFLRG